MPYLQVDLDAMRKWPMVAAGLGVSEGDVYRGFMKLWETAWREKSSAVSLLYLECLFGMPGRGERCAEILCGFGFLEEKDGGLRICGAEKYLMAQEARSRGGKMAAANGNLKRGKVAGKPPKRTKSSSSPPEPSSSSWKPAGSQLESTPSCGPALTPNTQHPTPNIETNTSVGLLADPVSPEKRVFAHWVSVMGKNGNTAFDANRRGKVEARLRDGFSPESLMLAVDGCAKTPHNMGENDRGERYDDLALICRDAAHVERFIRNATAPPKRAAGGRFFAAQDADKTSLAKVGVIHDF